MAQSSEYVLLSLAALVAFFLVYWFTKSISRKFGGSSGKQLNNLESINERYMDLIVREETLQAELASTVEQYNSVKFLFNAFIAVLLVALLIAYRQGPNHLVYTA